MAWLTVDGLAFADAEEVLAEIARGFYNRLSAVSWNMTTSESLLWFDEDADNQYGNRDGDQLFTEQSPHFSVAPPALKGQLEVIIIQWIETFENLINDYGWTDSDWTAYTGPGSATDGGVNNAGKDPAQPAEWKWFIDRFRTILDSLIYVEMTGRWTGKSRQEVVDSSRTVCSDPPLAYPSRGDSAYKIDAFTPNTDGGVSISSYYAGDTNSSGLGGTALWNHEHWERQFLRFHKNGNFPRLADAVVENATLMNFGRGEGQATNTSVNEGVAINPVIYLASTDEWDNPDPAYATLPLGDAIYNMSYADYPRGPVSSTPLVSVDYDLDITSIFHVDSGGVDIITNDKEFYTIMMEGAMVGTPSALVSTCSPNPGAYSEETYIEIEWPAPTAPDYTDDLSLRLRMSSSVSTDPVNY